ncbi:YceD family protein [Salipaludibacillus daqingensis]|uniref:YceD family protein n=1 Tax=Salipaludibacillus daqingensis TaxID=3041001 RepID=UPI0024758072|nr:YceD family protein [Salipaludibacillus daqingensis]
MKWSVQQLLAFKKNGLHIDESVDMSKIKEIDREVREINPVKVKGDAFFTRDAVTFQLELSGSMTLPCARTLNDVEYPFSINATEIFQLDEWATFDNDEDVHELEDDTVDLMPYLQERVLLEKPMRVFSELKEGPAPESGEGWQLTNPDEEQQQKIDPRLKELEKFFDKK